MAQPKTVIPDQLQSIHLEFWNAHASKFDMTHASGCGLYVEAWVIYAQDNGYPRVGHLIKNPGQTQYNGHAVDAFLYNEPDPVLLRAVDIIGAAESTDPNNPPRPNWGVDIPRYTQDDWSANAPGESSGGTGTVPWMAYDENSFQKLKDALAFDYGRRPQEADFDVTIWAARVFHSAYMGPSGVPLGLDAAIDKHRPEWCAALGVTLVPLP